MEGDEYFNLEEEPSDWSGKLKFSHLCRVCANPNGYLIPIFEGEGLDHELGMKIQKHLPIQVFEIDSLPKQMCYQCASTLIAWHDLTIGCIEADKKLRQLQCEKQQEQQQSQVQDSEDDKVTEFFDTPSVEPENIEPEKSDVTITQSRTAAESSPSLQTQVEKKIPCTKKKRRVMEKPSKVKMVLLRGPTAGPSRHLTATKSQSTKALDIVKAKGGTTQEFGTTERCQPPPLSSFYDFEQVMYTPRITSPNLSTSALNANLIYTNMCKNINNANELSTDVHDSGLNSIKIVEEILEQSEEERPIYECEHCGKKLASRENMRVHLRIHTGERPFTCHICGKQFQAQSGIKRHLKEVHEGVRDQVCDICGRGFANKRTLEDHRRIHTGERPYVCDLCGKTFKTKASLYVHKRSHSDIFPFKCTSCEKRFRTQTPLSLHVLKHTGEKPHACNVCGKCFRIKYELGKHKLIHSEGKPFSCEKCGHAFRQRKYLKNHNKTHHMKVDSML